MLPLEFRRIAHCLRNRGLYKPLGSWLLTYGLRFERFRAGLTFGAPVHHDGPEKLTVILLSFKRPENIPYIVRSYLRLPYVRRIIVSNNNPELRMADWLHETDPRVRMVDQPEPTRCGIRYELAREDDGDFFITVDDDLFLTPAQIHRVFLELVRNPAAPHGVQGAEVILPEGRFVPAIRGVERQLDILNRLYALTRAHLEEYFRLMALLGLKTWKDVDVTEDIVASFSGQTKPWIHDVGTWADCPTGNRKDVALWRSEEDFRAQRRERFRRLAELKPLK